MPLVVEHDGTQQVTDFGPRRLLVVEKTYIVNFHFQSQGCTRKGTNVSHCVAVSCRD